METESIETGIIFVISGPSGVGKGTVCKRLLQEVPGLSLSISATSRPKRPDEVEGKDYFFLSRELFEARVGEGAFLEWAQYNGNYYGTPRFYVEKMLGEGRHVLLEIDTQGALRVKELYPQAYMILLEPPSLLELKNRLESRGTNTPEDIERRMGIALEELSLKGCFDWSVVNQELEACCREICRQMEGRLRQQVR